VPWFFGAAQKPAHQERQKQVGRRRIDIEPAVRKRYRRTRTARQRT
jgi:hypothetical protein